MGLGGYLTWTAAIREIKKKQNINDLKIIPVEMHREVVTKIAKSPAFDNNPHVTYDLEYRPLFFLQMNCTETNYCKHDSCARAVHRYDKHIIEQICEYYGINEPYLKCEIYFSREESRKIDEIRENLSDKYIVIEPISKENYTVNRKYCFKKWQKVVDILSKDIDIIQVGIRGSPVLKNVTDLTGKTNFKEAVGVIKYAKMLLSTEGGLTHASTAVDTSALVIITGYQEPKMVCYPQNININIASHGPCGYKTPCKECERDIVNHDYMEIVTKVQEFLF